jgi:hypothetical protein
MVTILDRIAAYFGYVRREYPRINNGSDAVATGKRWESFYTERAGLADMIEGLRRSYFEKVGSIKPGDTDALQELGMADRIAREIDAKVREVIETGKIATANAAHADRVAATRR